MEDAAFIQRKMIENSDRVLIVVDASKFGKQAPSRVIPTEDLSLIVTNFTSENYHVVQQMIKKGIRFEFVRS
jgi:DeoR/GlpR family transcriptional regulator of sugar metabolism